MQVHHVAYAVSSIEGCLPSFRILGFEPCGDVVEDASRKVIIQFIGNEQGLLVELVQPMSEDSPASSYLKGSKGSPTPYHLCYEVDDIEESVAELKKVGFIPIVAAAPAPAIEGKRVIFCYGRKAGLIELVESRRNDDN